MDSDGRYDPNKGLFLWGDIGVGKTTILKVVREFCRTTGVRPGNRLCSGSNIEMPYSFAIKSVHEILEDYQSKAESLGEYADNPQLAIDDIGAEAREVNRFGTVKNVIDELIHRRYARFCNDRRFTTHITANIEPQTIKSHYSERAYDRCKEMFNFIEIRGNSYR